MLDCRYYSVFGVRPALIVLLGAVLFSPFAQAQVAEGCAQAGLSAESSCQRVGDGACQESCDSGRLAAACEAEFREVCDATECVTDVDADCKIRCVNNCQPLCDGDPSTHECADMCGADCRSRCAKRCRALSQAPCADAPADEKAQCLLDEELRCTSFCLGSCGSECETFCEGIDTAEAGCGGACGAACSGACKHSPVSSCRIECRYFFQEGCLERLTVQCEDDCRGGEILFCDDQYVDHQGDIDGCRASLELLVGAPLSVAGDMPSVSDAGASLEPASSAPSSDAGARAHAAPNAGTSKAKAASSCELAGPARVPLLSAVFCLAAVAWVGRRRRTWRGLPLEKR